MYDDYDLPNEGYGDCNADDYEEENEGENEDYGVFTNTNDSIDYESYEDLYQLYERICATEKLFLSYRTELEKALNSFNKMIGSYKHGFSDEQLKELQQSIAINRSAFENCKGKSDIISEIIEGNISDICYASDKNSETAVFNINDFDYQEKLVEPLSAIINGTENIEESIINICDTLTDSDEMIEEAAIEGTSSLEELNEQIATLEELSREVSFVLSSIFEAFQDVEGNLCGAE